MVISEAQCRLFARRHLPFSRESASPWSSSASLESRTMRQAQHEAGTRLRILEQLDIACFCSVAFHPVSSCLRSQLLSSSHAALGRLCRRAAVHISVRARQLCEGRMVASNLHRYRVFRRCSEPQELASECALLQAHPTPHHLPLRSILHSLFEI